MQTDVATDKVIIGGLMYFGLIVPAYGMLSRNSFLNETPILTTAPQDTPTLRQRSSRAMAMAVSCCQSFSH